MEKPSMRSLTEQIPLPEPFQGEGWGGPGDGVSIAPGFFDEDDPLLLNYEACWQRENGYGWEDHAQYGVRKGGWPDATPYMRHREIRDLLCDRDLAEVLFDAIGEPAGLHLNLTGWVSTQRNWHQDTYLNPPHVGDAYAAVWIALEDIHPDSGPFQYVPGSHRWPVVTQDKIAQYVDLADPAWPTYSEAVLTPLWEAEIRRRKATVVTHLPKRGDLLIWHSRLVHRGSAPNVPGMRRKALIAHYSGIHHRQDMPPAVEHQPGGGLFFPLGGLQPATAPGYDETAQAERLLWAAQRGEV